MRINRRSQLRILRVLNDFLPPVLRDTKWFMRLPMRLVFGRHAELVMEFKPMAFEMNDDEIVAVYRQLWSRSLTMETDLNEQCLERVLDDIVGTSVLEVGCGDGALASMMSRSATVTACDIIVRRETRDRCPTVFFCEASIEQLPFGDKEFDTVVSTHTLEHVRDVRRAIDELRRVARRRVIVVVPSERPYRYTFNLHLHFFPYEHLLRAALGEPAWRDTVCEKVAGDLYYREDITTRD